MGALGRGGTGLVDLLFLGGVMALAAVLVYPPYQRHLLRASAEKIHRQMELVETAVSEAADRREMEAGDRIEFSQYGPFLGEQSYLRKTGKDVFGNALGAQTVGEAPRVPPATVDKLRGIVGKDFWEPYLAGGRKEDER